MTLLPVGEDQPSEANRRAHPRLCPPYPVTVLLRVSGFSSTLSGRLRDLSAGGTSLYVGHRIPPGAHIGLQLINATATFALEVELTVLRSEPGGAEWLIAGEFDRTLLPDEIQPLMR